MTAVRDTDARGEGGQTSARERTYRFLRQQITTGVYGGGTRIVEEQVAQELGVSRTPVREALQRLTSEGLILRVRRGHLIVVEFGPQARAELHMLRVAFDQVAAELLVHKKDTVDWPRLYALLDPLARAYREHGIDSTDYRLAHLDLHMGINREAFSGLTSGYLERQAFLHPSDDYVQQPGHEPVDQHRHLLDELATGDLERVRAAMAEHAIRAYSPDNAREQDEH